MLPCVIAFEDGVGVDRVIGFEGLGGGGGGGGGGEGRGGSDGDGFRTRDLETRLLGAGVLVGEKKLGEERLGGRKGTKDEEDNGDDDDWD